MLSTLAFESKQFWGYPDEWMELWREDLTITPDMIEQYDCRKILITQELAGFAMISEDAEGFEIEHCFIKPGYIGQGLGTLLLKQILAEVHYAGKSFRVIADPNAVRFYAKFGFETVSQVPSEPASRSLPLMKMINSVP